MILYPLYIWFISNLEFKFLLMKPASCKKLNEFLLLSNVLISRIKNLINISICNSSLITISRSRLLNYIVIHSQAKNGIFASIYLMSLPLAIIWLIALLNIQNRVEQAPYKNPVMSFNRYWKSFDLLVKVSTGPMPSPNSTFYSCRYSPEGSMQRLA